MRTPAQRAQALLRRHFVGSRGDWKRALKICRFAPRRYLPGEAPSSTLEGIQLAVDSPGTYARFSTAIGLMAKRVAHFHDAARARMSEVT